MTDPLQKLFGSMARLKLLRLFLFNPGRQFTVPEAAERARVPERTARKEINLFASVRLIKRARSRSRGARYLLNSDFGYLAALQSLLLNAPERGADIYERVRKAGGIKLVIIAGIFVGEWESALDVLIVGDRVKEKKLRSRIKNLESELAKELRYSLLSIDDFFYRLNMNDKLVRDILDYQHKIVFDRLNIGLK